MTNSEIRLLLVSCYPNSYRWRNRVTTMSDSQVYAIYNRFKREGRFEEKKDAENHQYTLFEFGLN